MDQTPTSLVILLHGVGSSGDDIGALADHLAPALPGAVFACPDAPEPFDRGGPGRQWFSVAGVTPANRPTRIADARAGFDQTIGEIITAAGFASRLDRVAFVGFSQGSIMALDAVASGRWPVAAVVAFSGRLASPSPLAPAPHTRCLLVHGSADMVIPAGETLAAAEHLTALGLAVEHIIEPGEGHSISANGLGRAIAFLTQTLGKEH